MGIYVTTIGTWYIGVVAAHSEDEAVEQQMIKVLMIYLAVVISYFAGFTTCSILATSKEDDNFG